MLGFNEVVADYVVLLTRTGWGRGICRTSVQLLGKEQTHSIEKLPGDVYYGHPLAPWQISVVCSAWALPCKASLVHGAAELQGTRSCTRRPRR